MSEDVARAIYVALGLTGSPTVPDHIEFIDDHFHNLEHWMGVAAVPTATHWGDLNTLTPWQAVSGNNTWGAALQVLGSADTPIFAGGLWQDIKRILVLANSSNTVYKLRLLFGTGTSAAAIAAGQYTEFVFFRGAGDNVRKVADLQNIRVPSTYQRWLQIWNATNLATLDFLLGIHEYPSPLEFP